VATLEADVQMLLGEKAGLEAQLAQARGELAELRQVAAEPVAVAEENQGLRKALLDEQEKTRRLADEVRDLRDRSLKEWFMIGAGVSLGSLFLGLIIPRIRWRRRGWDDFR
jgi:SH3 domain protein